MVGGRVVIANPCSVVHPRQRCVSVIRRMGMLVR